MSRLSGMAAAALAAWAPASWAGEATPRPAKHGPPRDYLDSFLPLPERFDTKANPATDAKIALGRMLFFDRRLSQNGRLACHGCHDLKAFGADARMVSLGDVGLPLRAPHVPALGHGRRRLLGGLVGALD